MIDLESFAERYEKTLTERCANLVAKAERKLLFFIIRTSIEDNKSEEETITLISKELEVDEETARQYYYKYHDEVLQQED